jgi:EAL domain-containing protein (putative c-di-GMP-specific phosphodiesterase class I)/GGDEF domain-containing protein
MTNKLNQLILFIILLICYGASEWLFSSVLVNSTQQRTFTLNFPLVNEQFDSQTEIDRIERIVVTGFFSDWRTDMSKFELIKQSQTNRWQQQISLPAGDNQYKFVVTTRDGATHWILDPENPETTDDSHGGVNSVASIPDYAQYRYMVNLVLICLLVGSILYFFLHAFINWLLTQKLLISSKLIVGALSIIFLANTSFIVYQVYEMRKGIVLAVQDEIHLIHLYLTGQNVNFDNLEADEGKLKESLNTLLWEAKTRVEKSQSSPYQITLSDLAIFTPEFDLIALQTRQQNDSLQGMRKDQIGYGSLEQYYLQGVFKPLLNLANNMEVINEPIVSSPNAEIIEIETFFTTWSRSLLGFSNILVPITEYGTTKGYYVAAIQVKMYGQEILRVILIGLMLSLVICFISFLLLRSYGNRITQQLQGMIAWVQNINDGDLSTSFEVGSKDELQTLNEQLGKMQISLNANFEKIKHQNQLLNKTAFFDHITDLPNKNKLRDDIHHTMPHSLVLIELSEFERIVNFLGNDFSSQIAKESVFRLKKALGENKKNLYRLTSGCFAVINLSPDNIQQTAQQLCCAISDKPFLTSDIPFDIHAVAGINISLHNESSAELILAQTELALHEANTLSRLVVVYEARMDKQDHFARNIDAVEKLKHAIEKNTLVPFYQPIVDSQTQEIVKLECLARIQVSEHEITLPAEFLPAAFQSGLYPQLSKTIFTRSFEELRKSGTPITINMSALDIATVQAERNISSLISEYSDVADRVTLEITETEQIEDYKAMVAFISKAKGFGCKIALDDFGAGYSNFTHLLALQVDYLKIDGSIIRELDTDSNARRICKAIVECAQALDIRTIAEFVHNEEIYTIVKDMGVHYCQGYYFGAPSREHQSNK